MDKWEVVTVIIALGGFLIALVKCIVPLTNSITTLNCTVKNLNDRIDIVNTNDSTQDAKLENHEIRLTKIEDKIG